MATYKVIQDIEAEDKFVGPLTLKQFIFAMGGGLFGYLSFFALTRGFLLALTLTLPPMLFGFFMAVPWSKDQPTDVWVLAKLRFRLKAKKRIWDQDGVMNLVTITAPKREEKPLTKNMSQTEVKSRLKALADTIDSRGWVTKHAQFQQQAMPIVEGSSDRLVSTDVLPQEVPETDPNVPDILEEQPKIDALIQKSDEDHKERIYKKMDRIRQGAPIQGVNMAEPVVAPPLADPGDEQSLSASLKAKRAAGGIGVNNMHSIPASSGSTTDKHSMAQPAPSTEVEKAQASMTEQRSPDILELSRDNGLKVSTIAKRADDKEANKEPEEVVISLH